MIRTILKVLTTVVVVTILVLPIIFSYELEEMRIDKLQEIWELQDQGIITLGNELKLVFLERLFGIGISAIFLIIITILFLLANVGEIMRGSMAVLIGTKMADEDK